ADLPQPVTTTAPVRANEPVVLTGSLFPDWSAGPELTFRASQVPVDYGVADSQGLQPAYLRSDCYVANPPPAVDAYVDTNHPDPNPWLIDTDEMAFMARDTGAQAPPGATLPRGIADAREVVITDPITLQQSFAYVMLSAKNTDGTYRVTPRFTAANSPYVFYQ